MEEDPGTCSPAIGGGAPAINGYGKAVAGSLETGNHHATQNHPNLCQNKEMRMWLIKLVQLSFQKLECLFNQRMKLMRCTTHAGKVGFSIRKSYQKRRPKDYSISQKYMVCSSEGYTTNTKSSKDTARSGCNARVQFRVSREGVWTVQKVVLDHNHYLASPNKSHKLRSQRHVIEADRMLIGQIREAGMKPAQVYEFMKQFYGGADKVPFSRMDCNNEIGRECNKYLETNDAQTLLEYLKNKQTEDPTFFMQFS
ncbi:hypothetical protein U9M48_044319 [Paspalum notatum var. saurae]|uniref:FAR1 domain-containing protein n=1 Tax=Paspalum notatum var. saurae TaxID=547442 RepID=A0AAQ3V136_PASNO